MSVEPHGVIVEAAGPANPGYVDLAGKVCGHLMPMLAGELRARRAGRPAMRTMDGEEVMLISATVQLSDGRDPGRRCATIPTSAPMTMAS